MGAEFDPFKSLDPNDFQTGSLWAAPNAVLETYPGTIAPTSASVDDAAKWIRDNIVRHVSTALGAGYTGVDYYGHSERTQAMCRYLTLYAATSISAGVDPTKVRFLMAAPPEHPYNGIINTAQYGTLGVPVTCPFDHWFMTRQYDAVADVPNTLSNLVALLNFQPWLGMNVVPVASPAFVIHLGYGDVPFFDPGGTDSGYVTWTDPAHTKRHFIWARTYPLASLQSVYHNGAWLKNWARSQDKKFRATAESAWARPATIPAPSYG